MLYKKESSEEWTHAARIVSDGIEHSKFGPAWDGQHSHNVLCKTGLGQEHQSYGVAYAYMRKLVICDKQKSDLKGSISVSASNLAKMKALLRK